MGHLYMDVSCALRCAMPQRVRAPSEALLPVSCHVFLPPLPPVSLFRTPSWCNGFVDLVGSTLVLRGRQPRPAPPSATELRQQQHGSSFVFLTHCIVAPLPPLASLLPLLPLLRRLPLSSCISIK
eukprot:EG_transcript_49397